ncbi:Hypothetical predicted protein [Paramuricea clavata]|uniref:Uncharacterized protein n=1 Tax=Paramuricea clavata TaxID=317549 RepID=A0A6S7IXY7_PARCT|nr:Hypothetical predicted protein [Paramuricea clavata]
MDEEVMIELQSCILGLNITNLKDFGIKRKWLTVETTEGKGKFELIKTICTAFEDEASECKENGFLDLVEKIKSLLYEQTLDKSNEDTEKAEKNKQELVELETQYEQLSKAQEELKQKMQLLELALTCRINQPKSPKPKQVPVVKLNCLVLMQVFFEGSLRYKEKSATELYQLLANISQSPKEDPQSFLIRALTTRQKIVFASQESDSKIKYDEELVQGLFLHAVETGLADETIRAKIRPLLKNPSVADEDLIEAMSLAMSAESERANKFTQGKPVRPSTKISKVEAGASGEPKENNPSNQRENQILATLKAIQSELNTVQSEVASLQKKVDDKDYPSNHPAEGAARSVSEETLE